MVGAIPGDVVMHDKPFGRGYVQLAETGRSPWPQLADVAAAEVRGHEFHYSSLQNLSGDVQFAYEVRRGHGVDGRRDGIVYRNVLASYAHLRGVGANEWVARFVVFVRQTKSSTRGRRAVASDGIPSEPVLAEGSRFAVRERADR